MEDQYYVVLFDDYVATVHKNWINFVEQIVYWPDKKLTNKVRLEKPKKEWKKMDIKKIEGPFGTLKEALQLEKYYVYLDTSDDGMEIAKEKVTSKRTIKKNKKYLSTSADDSSDDETINGNKEDPPAINETEIVHEQMIIPQSKASLDNTFYKVISENTTSSDGSDKTKLSNSSTCNGSNNKTKPPSLDFNFEDILDLPDSEDMTETFNGLETNDCLNNTVKDKFSSLAPKKSFVPKRASTIVRHGCANKGNFPSPNVTSTLHQVSHESFCSTSSQDNICYSPQQSFNAQRNCNTDKCLTEEKFRNIYYKNIMRKFNELSLKLDGCINIGEKPDAVEENLLPNFPLDDLRNFDEFDLRLKNEQQVKIQFTNMIKKIGGSNPGNYVRAVCRKTLDPGLIYNNFSWSGTRNLNKRKFNSTSVCNEIIDAIVSAKPIHTNKEISKYVMTWVQRTGGELKSP